MAEPEQIFSSRCHTEQAAGRSRLQTFFLANDDLVELDGIEPTTPCLQSRCSPS